MTVLAALAPLFAALDREADHSWLYVTLGYTITLSVLVLYSVWVIVRGRRLSKQLPPEDRRWM